MIGKRLDCVRSRALISILFYDSYIYTLADLSIGGGAGALFVM